MTVCLPGDDAYSVAWCLSILRTGHSLCRNHTGSVNDLTAVENSVRDRYGSIEK